MMEKYKQTLLNNASKLDAVTNSCGEITKLANVIVVSRSKLDIMLLLKKISNIVDNSKYRIEIKRIAQLVMVIHLYKRFIT